MHNQILTDSFRVRGPLGYSRTEAIADLFGEETGHDSNRLPFGRPARNDRTAAFTKIRADELYQSLYARVVKPSRIDQKTASLCGPASLLFLTATYYPTIYTRYIGDLYEFGSANLGQLSVKPGKDCKNYDPTNKIDPADWVGLAGLRDSENTFFDYDEVEDAFAGITLPGQLATWLSKVGFSDIREETNIYLTKGEDNFREAASLKEAGFNVCLFVDADAINGMPKKRGLVSQIFTTPNHWVVLTSDIEFVSEGARFRVYTWGEGERPIPPLGYPAFPMDVWLQHYYGFVACST